MLEGGGTKMKDFLHRAIKVPRGTHLRDLTLRPHSTDGPFKKVTVHKANQEVGHFMLSENQKLSDFSWTLQHRQLFLKLKQPVHNAASSKVHGLRGWISSTATWVGCLCSNTLWLLSVMTLLMTIAINKEPAAAKWAQLDACTPGFFALVTWEDWRQADVFHLLYDWLLVLLQERLLSSQAAHADSVTIAWFQILWVATITVLLLIVSAAKLVLTALRHLFKSGQRQHPLAAWPHPAQQPWHADEGSSLPPGTKELRGPQSGSTSGPIHELIPANAMPSSAADSEENSCQAKLANMRKALEEAGVDTVSRADAHATKVEAENKALRFQVSSLSAQLTAVQQSSAFFRKLFFSASRERVAADKRARSALQQTAAKTSAMPKHGSVSTQENRISNRSAIAQADTFTSSSANPSSVTNASTAAANTSAAAALPEAAPATATEAASDRALSIADELRLSAESRVVELSTANASLQGKLQRTSADLQQAEFLLDKQETRFSQANKMRQRAEENLSGVAAERNQLLRLVSDLVPEQVQANSLSPADQDNTAYEHVPEGDCIQQDNKISNGSAIAQADTFTSSSVNPSSVTNASTAAANTSAAAALPEGAPATATEAASDRALSIADKLQLSAESRVIELSTANASLQGKLQRTSADLQQAEFLIDKQETRFSQANKMRQRAEENLSGVAAERNQLLRLVSDLVPEQVQANSLLSPADQEKTAYENVPEGDCFQQTSLSEGQTAPDQIYTQTPAKNPSRAYNGVKTLEQTDMIATQIPAVRAGQSQLQELQKELESKQQVIESQAADITDAAVKMSAQQGMMQRLRADLRARELAALLFHVRLVPTKGFKGDQFDVPLNAKLLGEGGSSTIYQETLFGEIRATKYPKKGLKAQGALANELCMHLRCAGPNTVSILSVGMDKVPRGPVLSANVICFSMEMATMSLKAYIAQASGGFKGSNREGLVLSMNTTKLILRQVIAAIQGLHRTHTLHADVKPDNFLVFCQCDRMSCVKITDFGLSQTLVNDSHAIAPTAEGTRGTPGWIAPEMYVQNLLPAQKHKPTVSAAADVYAAGWVFFEVLCGLSPLLFQDAKTNGEFAAGAATVAPLDSKVHRQEINLELEESSSETVLSSNSRSSISSAAAEPAVNEHNGSDSCLSEAEFVAAPDIAAGHADCIDTQGTKGWVNSDDNPDAGRSNTDQAVHGLHPADDADMVYLYPEYLLSGTGLMLLELCVAMWARDPEARPSCQDILEQLAVL